MSLEPFHKVIQGSVLLLKTYAVGIPLSEQIKLKGLI